MEQREKVARMGEERYIQGFGGENGGNEFTLKTHA
jgi:hypothetical protein